MRKFTEVGDLPDAGGLSGVKRMQMYQAGVGRPNGPGRVGTGNTGIVPPKPTPTKVVSPGPVGYEQPRPASFNQRLSTLSTPNFPRRRGQG